MTATLQMHQRFTPRPLSRADEGVATRQPVYTKKRRPALGAPPGRRWIARRPAHVGKSCSGFWCSEHPTDLIILSGYLSGSGCY